MDKLNELRAGDKVRADFTGLRRPDVDEGVLVGEVLTGFLTKFWVVIYQLSAGKQLNPDIAVEGGLFPLFLIGEEESK